MSDFVHTLTAYHVIFSYMKRNNPLREELSDEIKSGAEPKLTFKQALKELIKRTENRQFYYLINSDKIILLDEIENEVNIDTNKNRMLIIPKVGKVDMPVQMINLKNKYKTYNFNEDWTSAYRHYIFIYEINNQYYIVCHRNGGSGCKTILYSALNKILKEKGIKVEMNLILPEINDSISDFDVDKISLIYEEKKSSDIADEPTKKRKKVHIKELTLSLKTGRFSKITNLIKSWKLKEISKEETFKEIKNEVNDDQYNNASLIVKIGNLKKRVSWKNFENLIDGFDITERVSKLKGNAFLKELEKCSDEFIFSLLKDSSYEH